MQNPNEPVTLEDYDRTRLLGGNDSPAVRAHLAISRALSAYADDPTTGKRGEVLRAIAHFTGAVQAESHEQAAKWCEERADRMLAEYRNRVR